MQVLPVEHWVDDVQDVGQLVLVPSHRYGEQPGLPAAPDAAAEHVPNLPATLQASQELPQAVSQQ